MKIFRKVIMVVLAIAVVFGTIACTKKTPVVTPGGNTTASLTPSDITQLADLTNYSLKDSYYAPVAVTYASTATEESKLTNRINNKKNDPGYADFSSVVKIFANSNASSIISAMSVAALPNAKMTAVVDYLAGESTVTVDENTINGKVDSNTWSVTPGWSFFDDYDYYEKLQDKADISTGNEATDNTNSDNVKRQYRNIAGKVFAIGMTGDEFARTFVREMLYAITVVESTNMSGAAFNANPSVPADDAFWNYCKTQLDYDILVYFLAFKDYYSAATGLANSVQLYGYYYDYEKKNYDETTDTEFEKGLTYGHQTTFTNAEWLEYIQIQRDNYTSSYRYSDNFYEKSFYAVHLAFQELKEIRENTVYDITAHNSLLYTGEMRNGMSNGGFAGQLKMSDWMWCYNGDDAKMTAYNDVNTMYETGKNQGAENASKGEFYYDQEQLKITSYLLGNMTNTELGCALRYQIYNYSSDMMGNIQGNKKDDVLISVDKKDVEAYITTNGYATTATDAKEYAIGKNEALISQMASSLSNVSVSDKAQSAASESWVTIKEEVDEALKDTNYASITSFIDKLERLEDLVIKRKWSCGAELDDYSTCQHAECTKEYDTTHAISKFADKYATILRHVSGQSVMTFENLASNNVAANNYNLVSTGSEVDVWYAPSYYAVANSNQALTPAMLVDANKYSQYEEITIESGLGFKEGVLDAAIDSNDEVASGTTEGQNWWNKKSSATKATAVISEQSSGNNSTTDYTYTYSFIGWYLDKDLQFRLEDLDEVNCDLTLYAGYRVKKN